MKTLYYVAVSLALVVLTTLTHASPVSPSNDTNSLANSGATQQPDIPQSVDANESTIPEPDTQSDPDDITPQSSTEPDPDSAPETTTSSAIEQPEPIDETTPTPLMHNGEKYDDPFYAKFLRRENPDDTVALALTWDGVKQHDHFKQMKHHIRMNDDHAEYAQQIIHAAQRLLDSSLKKAEYPSKPGEINVEDYVNAAYTMQKYHRVDDEKMGQVLQALYDCPGDDLELATDAGDEIRDEYKMEHLPAHKETPMYEVVTPHASG